MEAGAESSSEWIVLVDDLIDELIDEVIDYAEDGRYLAGLVGPFLPHISHINPARCVVISNSDTRCSRIAEHSGYHEC